MKFFKGKVSTIGNSGKTGTFNVNVVDGYSEFTVPVNYVSPFFNNFEGGIFSPPKHGAEVFIAFDHALGSYYYFGTVVGSDVFTNPEIATAKKINTNVINERLAYDKKNMPSMMTFTDHDEQGLRIYNYLDDEGGVFIKRTTIGNAYPGNRIEVDDSPDKDQILLINKHGDSIRLTSSDNENVPERSIAFNALQSVTTNASNGDIRLDLEEGRDITIKNNSIGRNGGIEVPLPLGNGTVNPIPAGNLNLITKYRDINIYSEELPGTKNPYAGRILISTPQGKIQIKSGSDGLTLYSEGHINIASVIATKTIIVDALGDDPLTNGFYSGKVISLLPVGAPVQSGDIVASIEIDIKTPAGTDAKQIIGIRSPYTGSIISQLTVVNGVVSLFQPLLLLQTAGGDINLLADRNINLQAPNGYVNTFATGIKSTSVLDTTLASVTLGVSVAGPSFTLGTVSSNISISNGGGPIYAPQITPVIPPVPLQEAGGLLPIIPDVGAYFLSKQS